MTDKLTEAIETLEYHIKVNGSQDWFLRGFGPVILDEIKKYHALPVVDARTLGNELHKKYEDYLSRHDYFQMPDSQIRFAARYIRATYPDGLRWEK